MLEEVHNFLILVKKSRINQEAYDRIVWKGDKKGLYYVRANAALIEGNVGRIALWKMLWNNLVPPKVCFFAWEVWWVKVLTMEQLRKRGF